MLASSQRTKTAFALDERQLTATTPSGDTSMPVDVLVTAPDGKQAVALRAYTFDDSMPLGNFVDCPRLAKAFTRPSRFPV